MANPYVGGIIQGVLQGYQIGADFQDRQERKKLANVAQANQEKEFGLRQKQAAQNQAYQESLMAESASRIADAGQKRAATQALYDQYGGLDKYTAAMEGERKTTLGLEQESIKARTAASRGNLAYDQERLRQLQAEDAREQRGRAAWRAMVEAAASDPAATLQYKLDNGIPFNSEDTVAAYSFLSVPELVNRLGDEHKVSSLVNNSSFKKALSSVGEVKGDKIKIGNKSYDLDKLTAVVEDVPTPVPGVNKQTGEQNVMLKDLGVRIKELPGVTLSYDTFATEGKEVGGKAKAVNPEALNQRAQNLMQLGATIREFRAENPELDTGALIDQMYDDLSPAERAAMFLPTAKDSKLSPEQYARKEILDQLSREAIERGEPLTVTPKQRIDWIDKGIDFTDTPSSSSEEDQLTQQFAAALANLE